MAKRASKKPLGMKEHVFLTFGLIFKNFKLFLPLLIIALITNLLLIGVSMDTLMLMGVALFLFLWLVSLFFTRHILSGRKVKFTDGLYNAMTPFFATLLILLLVILQCTPIFLLVIAYSAALETHFLATLLYAVLFLLFACAMISLSGFLLSDSLVALMAVSAPGMYPMRALKLANGLMKGKRGGFVIRLILMGIVIALMWVVVILPVSLLAMAVEVPFWLASTLVIIMGGFSVIYMAVYLYIYYRELIGYDKK